MTNKSFKHGDHVELIENYEGWPKGLRCIVSHATPDGFVYLTEDGNRNHKIQTFARRFKLVDPVVEIPLSVLKYWKTQADEFNLLPDEIDTFIPDEPEKVATVKRSQLVALRNSFPKFATEVHEKIDKLVADLEWRDES